MSTHRPSSSQRRTPTRNVKRRDRLQLSSQRFSARPRPPLPRLGPEPGSDVRDSAHVSSDEQNLSSRPSASRAGLWVGGILTRVGEQREHPFWASWLDAFARLLPRRSPFSWRERDWRGSAWGHRARVVPTVAALVIALLVAGTFAVTIATHAAGAAQSKVHLPTTQSASVPSNDVLRPLPAASTATPAAPKYLIGAWVSGTTAGSVKVFVRVTRGIAPAPYVPVSLWVDFPGYSSGFGPAVTDSDGVASITVPYVGLPPNEPLFITASATIGKDTVSAQTTFVTQ